MIYMQASPQYINSILILLQVKCNFWSETSSLLLFASMQNLPVIHSIFVLLISAWHYSSCKLSRNILSWSWPFFLNVRHYMRLSLPLMPSLDHCDSIFHNYIPSDGIHDKISGFYVPISDGCPLKYAIMVKFWENTHALIQFQSMQLTRHILISVEQ